MSRFLSRAQARASHTVDLRRRLHACPEVGFDLSQTGSVIRQELEALGIPFQSCGRSLVAHLGPSGDGGVLLRADADGISVKEETDLPFRSRNGAMHACGHDLHTAALLGAAALLNEEPHLPRPVKLLFQPAEEWLQGAEDAVASGVTRGIARAFMLHVTVGTGLPVGTVVIPPEGPIAPSADYFELTLEGVGCHGADPSSGIDPLPAAAQTVLSLQNLTARECPAGSVVLTVGSVQGGESFNVLPHRVTVRGSFRCFDRNLRDFCRRRIETVASCVGEAYRVKTKVSFPAGCPCLVNDPSLRHSAQEALSSALEGAVRRVDVSSGMAGSEDFAVISQSVPSLMVALSAGDCGVPLHHPKVVFDEACLPFGVAAYAALACLE